ncbi:MAG: SAM-dependent chlorinase/fluorinase [Nitrospinota bacterium]|nr:SAM-dependent chlorinase/fluorinase [Nitrospinota bacterium]MEC9018612.1 SAM-dependent chlorinase/fluorinase [Nitrospinota bacterium]MEC9423307.1 SAM-dependent chlorinase/fluorinase [Nitrospinota bacterium]
MRPLITLTTDFGLYDPFVGIMKGVILNIEPDAHIIDITHNIEPHNILQAARVLNATYPWYPRKTIHIIVVDPDVGGPEPSKKSITKKKTSHSQKSKLSSITGGRGPIGKRPILIQSQFQTFIGPDNGVLTPALGPKSKIYALNNQKYFLKNISNTFHGRDLFAPVAAWIANGIPPSKMGPRLLKPTQLNMPLATQQNKWIEGEIIYIDHFGNATTNISLELIEKTYSSSDTIEISIGKEKINRLVTGYYQVKLGQLGAILNSWNQIEIFCRENSAEKKLALKLGQLVTLKAK